MVENYSEDSIRTLDWQEHIRLRPGMYIGKLGDGSAPDDGIYILVKEVVDNSIDEFAMGAGTEITDVYKRQIQMQPDLKNWAATDISFYPYKGDPVYMQIVK